jgi:MFS family permease
VAQGLKLSDPVAFGMIFGSRAMVLLTLGFPCLAFVTYGVGFWSPPYLLRAHGVDLAEAGTLLGLGSALGGWMGVTLGGILADRLRARSVNGRVYIGVASPFLAAPAAIWFVLTDNVWAAYFCAFLFSMFSPMWLGAAASTVNDLVLPRMRAVASAYYILMMTFIGLALGPYLIGQVSDIYLASGVDDGQSLGRAILWGCGMLGVSLVFLAGAMRYLGDEEANRLDRARALGEPID